MKTGGMREELGLNIKKVVDLQKKEAPQVK